MKTHGPPVLQLRLRLHPHQQIHSPHRGGPHPLPGARQRGPPRLSGRPLPVPPRDTPPSPHNRTGIPTLRTLFLLSPLVGFTDDTNLTVAHTQQEPHTPDTRPTVTQQANNLLDVTISYLPRNNVIVQPTASVAMIKGSATAPTLGPQGPPMQVVEATTHLGVI